MASRRIGKSTVDWAGFAKKVPEAQKPQFNAFKAKSDGYVAKLSVLPETLPTIDWTLYQSRVSVSGMVADFKKQYEALTIPYPADSFSAKIEEQEKTAMAGVTTFVKEAETSIAGMKTELARVQATLATEDMYMEEFFDAYPDQALDPFDRPTMWPHTEEVQPDHIAQMEKDGKFDEEH